MAARGFLLGASAVALVFVLEDLISKGESSSLRGGGSNTSQTTKHTFQDSSSSSSTVEQEIRGINVNDKASNDGLLFLPTPSPQGQASYVPSAAPSTPIPTYMPTSAGDIPTEVPTQLDDKIVTSLVKLRSNNEVGFRLKLYWETGYYWQEEVTEKFWCMSCPSGECKRYDNMVLRDCEKKTDRDAQFVVTSAGKGHQFRVTNSNLCLKKNSQGRAIKLEPCDEEDILQQFDGFKSDGGKFDLKPSTSTKRCLSQHHHPKKGEVVYAETCFKAHRVDTGYWVAY